MIGLLTFYDITSHSSWNIYVVCKWTIDMSTCIRFNEAYLWLIPNRLFFPLEKEVSEMEEDFYTIWNAFDWAHPWECQQLGQSLVFISCHIMHLIWSVAAHHIFAHPNHPHPMCQIKSPQNRHSHVGFIIWKAFFALLLLRPHGIQHLLSLVKSTLNHNWWILTWSPEWSKRFVMWRSCWKAFWSCVLQGFSSLSWWCSTRFRMVFRVSFSISVRHFLPSLLLMIFEGWSDQSTAQITCFFSVMSSENTHMLCRGLLRYI